MNYTEILRTVGQIAGLGGLALGVFLLLTREVIRRVPPPRVMDRERYFRIINRVLLYTFLTALAGLTLYGVLTINRRTNEALAASNRTAFQLENLSEKYAILEADHEKVSERLKRVEEANLKVLTSGIEQIEKTVDFDLNDWFLVPIADQHKKLAEVKTTTTRTLVRTSAEAKKYYATYATSSPLFPEFVSSTHKLRALQNDERIPTNKPSLKRWLLEFNISDEPLFEEFELRSTVTAWNSFQGVKGEFGETLILEPCKRVTIRVSFPPSNLPEKNSVACYSRTIAQGDVLRPLSEPTIDWNPDQRTLSWLIPNPRLGIHYRLAWEWAK